MRRYSVERSLLDGRRWVVLEPHEGVVLCDHTRWADALHCANVRARLAAVAIRGRW